MKNSFSRMFQSMVEWFRSARRIRKEQTISPAEFQKMLAQTLADPDFKLLLLKSMAGTVWPIQGRNPGSGTPGYIAKFDSNGDATLDSVVKEVSGKVGIGTTSPSGVLSIEHAGSKGLYINETNSGFAGENIFQIDSATAASNAGLVSVNSGGNSRFYVRADGNVGIGTTTPGTPLQVVGTGYVLTLGESSSSTGKQLLLGISTTGNGYGKIQSLFQGTAYTTLALNPDGGNVAIGTTSPDSKLDVRGSINQIVYLRPNGSTDGTQINDAIGALPSNGGIIYLTPGSFYINTRLNINKNGVKLRGYGGLSEDEGKLQSPATAVTRLVFHGTSGDRLIKIAPGSGSPNSNIGDIELIDLTLDGNSLADGILEVSAAIHSKFIGLNIQNAKSGGAGLVLSAPSTTGDIDCAWNVFQNIDIWQCPLGLVLTDVYPPVLSNLSGSASNATHNTFDGFSIRRSGGGSGDVGIYLIQCDNNSLHNTWIDLDNGTGVLVNSPVTAYSNCFYHLETGAGGFQVINANAYAATQYKNLIFGYDLGNGSPSAPSSSPDSTTTNYVFWIDSAGQSFS